MTLVLWWYGGAIIKGEGHTVLGTVLICHKNDLAPIAFNGTQISQLADNNIERHHAHTHTGYHSNHEYIQDNILIFRHTCWENYTCCTCSILSIKWGLAPQKFSPKSEPIWCQWHCTHLHQIWIRLILNHSKLGKVPIWGNSVLGMPKLVWQRGHKSNQTFHCQM